MASMNHDRPDTPWARAIEDWPAWEEKHGYYADFAAWEAWMNSKDERSELLEFVRPEFPGGVALYAAMADAVDEACPMPLVVKGGGG